CAGGGYYGSGYYLSYGFDSW
nr:immunoglobulin heavy chain junction region [Macaca mulatta]